MNTEHTSKNILTYIKTHYGEAILLKIQKPEKTTIKYLSYTNHLRFFLPYHQNKIIPKDLQIKRRIKIKRNKSILHRASRLLWHYQIHINYVIRDRLRNSIQQQKGKTLESITAEEFHLVENIHQNSFQKSFGLPERDKYQNLMN